MGMLLSFARFAELMDELEADVEVAADPDGAVTVVDWIRIVRWFEEEFVEEEFPPTVAPPTSYPPETLRMMMGFWRWRSLPLPVLLPVLPPTPLLLLLLVVLPPRLCEVVESVIIEWLRLMSDRLLPAAPPPLPCGAPIDVPPPMTTPLPAALAPPPVPWFPFCCVFIIDGADAEDDGVEDAEMAEVAAPVGDWGEEADVELLLPRRNASRSSNV